MWTRNTYEAKVDITPRGEEEFHIPEPACECEPRLSQDTEGRLMIIHKSYDGVATFEPVDKRRAA